MTNLSINICDTSASLVLTSASYADQSISSSYSTSASWAPAAPTIGITNSFLINSGDVYYNFQYTNGLLTSVNANNVLNLSNTSSNIAVLNPTGEVQYQISNWTTVTGVGCVNMTQLAIYTNPLTYVNLSGSTSLSNLECNDSTTLTTIDISGLPALNYLDLSNNALTQTAIDGVLTSLVGFGLTDGTLLLQNTGGAGGTNGVPSAGGYTSASLLTTRGWSVTTN